jgi:amino acid transporter
VIYAWAKDGVLPSLAAYIPAKQHNPVLAVLVAAVLVQIGLLDAVLGGLMESPLALLPVIALSQTVPMLAAVVLPFTRRKWSSASPHIVWAGIGPLPVLSLVALVSLLFLLWMAFGPLVAPLLGVSFQLATLFWFVILLAVGVGFFLARKTHLPRSTFREFPQDELLDL